MTYTLYLYVTTIFSQNINLFPLIINIKHIHIVGEATIEIHPAKSSTIFAQYFKRISWLTCQISTLIL